MEQVWNGHGTDTQHNANSEILHSVGMEGSGTEFEDLIRSSGSGSGSGCALALVADLSYGLVAI